MTTPFKAKAEGVLVEVPEDTTQIALIVNQLRLRSSPPGYSLHESSVELPPGDWQLVGTSDTMSEDDWKGIVQEPRYFPTISEYRWFDYKEWNYVAINITESGHSLLPDPSKRYAVILKKNK